MTREILFRGFHKDEDEDGSTTIYVDGRTVTGRWVEGLPCYSWEDRTADKGEIKLTKKAYIGCIEALDERHNRIWAVIPSTVGQFTGLNDKNGRKIFEGDTMNATDWAGRERQVSAIEFYNGVFWIGGDEFSDEYIFNTKDREVTGTIFDKPRTDEAKTEMVNTDE